VIEPRDTSGRFKKGHGGRPKGSTNKRRAFSSNEFATSVTGEATEKLDALMQRAFAAVDYQMPLLRAARHSCHSCITQHFEVQRAAARSGFNGSTHVVGSGFKARTQT
jgi:hypothetical protein